MDQFPHKTGGRKHAIAGRLKLDMIPIALIKKFRSTTESLCQDFLKTHAHSAAITNLCIRYTDAFVALHIIHNVYHNWSETCILSWLNFCAFYIHVFPKAFKKVNSR